MPPLVLLAAMVAVGATIVDGVYVDLLQRAGDSNGYVDSRSKKEKAEGVNGELVAAE